MQGKVVARAREGNVRLARFLYCDIGGIIRGKASHVRGLSERLTGGLALTVAMLAMSGVDRLAKVDGLGPVGCQVGPILRLEIAAEDLAPTIDSLGEFDLTLDPPGSTQAVS